MSATVPSSSLSERMIRAARLETALYEEVEADTSATSQALLVVVIVAVASGLGAAIGDALFGTRMAPVGALLGGILAEVFGWAAFSLAIYLVGTSLFGGRATYGEVLRTTGFAFSPGVLLILRFVPVLGGLIALIVGIWRLVAGFIAVRQALDISNWNTVFTIIVAVIAYIVVALVIGVILGILGLGAQGLFGV